MSSWNTRPIEVANLLNPAYLAVITNALCEGYQSEVPTGLPFALCFVAIPLVAYTDTAALIPASARTKLHLWLQNNPEVLFDFAKRARTLVPYIREAIAFGVTHQVMQFVEGGRIVKKNIKGRKAWEMAYGARVMKQSIIIGKLLGR